jgi:hypothetical protein
VKVDASPECPGELALRLNVIFQAAETFEATRLGFLHGLVALLPQMIDGEISHAAWSVVSLIQIFCYKFI